MRTKEFNTIIQNLPYKEVTSGVGKDMETYSDKYVVMFDLDCDIEVVYYTSATYTNPEESEVKQTKSVSNIRVYKEAEDTKYKLNDVQNAKLAQEIEDNLNVIY